MERAAVLFTNILPDYMLVFAISILTHSPVYKTIRHKESVTMMQECLRFIIKPLVINNDSYNFGFYEMLKQVKNYVDAAEPNNEVVNEKLWSLCDLAKSELLLMNINTSKTSRFNNIRTSDMLFKILDDDTMLEMAKYSLPRKFQIEEVIGEEDSTTVDMSVESEEEEDKEVQCEEEDENVGV